MTGQKPNSLANAWNSSANIRLKDYFSSFYHCSTRGHLNDCLNESAEDEEISMGIWLSGNGNDHVETQNYIVMHLICRHIFFLSFVFVYLLSRRRLQYRPFASIFANLFWFLCVIFRRLAHRMRGFLQLWYNACDQVLCGKSEWNGEFRYFVATFGWERSYRHTDQIQLLKASVIA